jgi:hypothetical protein
LHDDDENAWGDGMEVAENGIKCSYMGISAYKTLQVELQAQKHVGELRVIYEEISESDVTMNST